MNSLFPGFGNLNLHDRIAGDRIAARLDDGGIRHCGPGLQIRGGLDVDL